MKTSDFSYIISMVSSKGLLLEHSRNMPILNNRLIVMLRVGDPNNLHLALFASEPKMYLFVSRIVSDFDSGYPNQLLKSHLLVSIGIKKLENGLSMLFLYVMLRLDKGKIVDEILETRLSILVRVVSAFPERFQVIVCYFSGLYFL